MYTQARRAQNVRIFSRICKGRHPLSSEQRKAVRTLRKEAISSPSRIDQPPPSGFRCVQSTGFSCAMAMAATVTTLLPNPPDRDGAFDEAFTPRSESRWQKFSRAIYLRSNPSGHEIRRCSN
jgi:hypothetical protein